MKSKVLVVEDNSDLAMNLKILLEINDYYPVVVENGLDALKILNKDSVLPDLVICDIMMPEMDGYELFEKILENPRWVNIPFIFLTAKSSINDMLFGKRLGVDDYLSKPFKNDELLAIVEGKMRKNKKRSILLSDLKEDVKEIEDKLFIAEEKFDRIFENSNISILLFDSEGYITDINKATMDLLGITDKGFNKYIEANLFEIPSLNDQDKNKLRNGEAIQLSIDLDTEKLLKNYHFNPLVKANNVYIDLLISPILKDGENKPSGYLAYEYQQIDAFIRKAHEILSEQVMERTQDIFYEKEKIKSIIESIPDGILVLSYDGQIQHSNEVFLNYYNRICNSELPGSIQEFDTSEDTFGEALFESFFKSEEDRILEVEEHLFLQITTKEVNLSIDDEFNKIIIVRNVTPFIELDNLRKQFVSSVSHELRTPITAISLSLDNIINYGNKMTKEQQESIIKMTKESSKILSQMIEDLLMVSRLDAKRIRLEMKSISLIPLVLSVLNVLQPLYMKKNINIKTTCISDSTIFADEKRINQVLRILVENAIKFSEENSSIAIIFNEDLTEGYIEIHVVDNGYGIRKKDLPHIFKRFYRATNVSNIRGTGLGLSIAKELIEQHGGSLSVRSQYKKGSTFTIRLPSKEKYQKSYEREEE